MYVDIVLDDSEMRTIQKGGFVSFVTPEGGTHNSNNDLRM